MSIEKKMELLADVLDVEAEDLDPAKKLEDYEEWDSVAVLSYIAMIDEEFGREIKGAEIKAFVTIQDALDAMN